MKTKTTWWYLKIYKHIPKYEKYLPADIRAIRKQSRKLWKEKIVKIWSMYAFYRNLSLGDLANRLIEKKYEWMIWPHLRQKILIERRKYAKNLHNWFAKKHLPSTENCYLLYEVSKDF